MTQAPAQSEALPLLFNRYRVREQVGEGRLAVVYSATDERLQRPVLVHLLRKELMAQPTLRQRFLDEITASAQRSHPALLELFDSGEANGRPFMVTEHVEGRPLRSLGVLTLEDALLYMRQVAGAVLTCQSAGVAHPPISSSNLLLVDDGRVKLVESWLLRPEAVPLDLAHYRPPERTRGEPPAPANVVYSLGLLLYELVAGRRPVQGDDARAVAQTHLSMRIPPLASARPMLYLPSLERLLGQATEREPAARLPNVEAFANALEALRREVGAETRQLAPPAPARRRRLEEPVGMAPVPAPLPSAPLPSLPQQHIAPETAPARAAQGHAATSGGDIRRQSARRSLVGWLVAIALLLGVAYGSYVGTSFLVNQFFNFQLPQIGLPSVISGGKQLVVNIEDLNLRDQPGLNTQVIRTVRLGTRVEQVEDPVEVDGVAWLHVRGEQDGERFEGWMSLKYLKEE